MSSFALSPNGGESLKKMPPKLSISCYHGGDLSFIIFSCKFIHSFSKNPAQSADNKFSFSCRDGNIPAVCDIAAEDKI